MRKRSTKNEQKFNFVSVKNLFTSIILFNTQSQSLWVVLQVYDVYYFWIQGLRPNRLSISRKVSPAGMPSFGLWIAAQIITKDLFWKFCTKKGETLILKIDTLILKFHFLKNLLYNELNWNSKYLIIWND